MDDGYLPQMLCISGGVGSLILNRAQIVSASYIPELGATESSLTVKTTGVASPDGTPESDSFIFFGRRADALHHFLFSGGYDVMKAYDCHQGKHVYKDDKAIVCENCRSWVQEREEAIRGTGHATDTDTLPF